MDLPTLEIVFRIRFFDGLATVERSVVHGSRPNRVLSIERGNGSHELCEALMVAEGWILP
jgi:hypothetical protein